MPPRGRRWQRPRRKSLPPQLLDPPPARDWAELPLDAISYILRKLGQVELLEGGVAAVCRSWRRAARHEPDLWRRINLSGLSQRPDDIPNLARAAVSLSAGQCEAFCSERLDDVFLVFLALRAPLLRSLSLRFCSGITSYGFAAVITHFPLLDELKLELCHRIDEVFEHVAGACPQMKHITHIKHHFYKYDITDPGNDREALAIASMPELRTLQLFQDKLTNTGLASIIDNCPRLESLDIRYCGNITVDDALRAKCARMKIKTLLLPDLKDYDYDYGDD